MSSLQLKQDSEVGTLFSALVAARKKTSSFKTEKPKHLKFGVLGASAINQVSFKLSLFRLIFGNNHFNKILSLLFDSIRLIGIDFS